MRRLEINTGDDEESEVLFVPEREADLYQDNDDLNIFEISNKDYDELSGTALRKLYEDSI